jgi:phosphoglycolate phosphatase-like HAD superfamily hydrolase
LTAKRIVRNVLRGANLPDAVIDERLDRWCARYAERYVELLGEADTTGWTTRPDAAAGLARLESRGVRLALVTGNPEPMARARLERLGLARFFPRGQGAFGCEAEERRTLLELARKRAGDWPAGATAEVGDTPADVTSAKADGVRSIAVTSARTEDPGELAGADVIVNDMGEIVRALLGELS